MDNQFFWGLRLLYPFCLLRVSWWEREKKNWEKVGQSSSSLEKRISCAVAQVRPRAPHHGHHSGGLINTG